MASTEEGKERELEPLIVESVSTSRSDEILEPLRAPPVLEAMAAPKSLSDDEEQGLGCAPSCRICLECDSGEPGDELISPCMCKGTQQFVHRSCLDHWRSVKEGFAFSHCTTCKAQFHLVPEIPEDYSWRKLKFKLFVARDVFLVFLAVQSTVAFLGALAYLMDSDGQFRESFNVGWDKILSQHPVAFYYCLGVVVFFVIVGVGGLIVHCSSASHHDSFLADCRYCSGCYIMDCFPASMEACGAFLVIFVILFVILGVAYGLLAATMAIQRIWQRHYHILTKRELTKEYIVADLHGEYVPPQLSAEDEERLRSLKLL
ncbi:E3 ubiquitin-protein ligase MARCH1 [Selaginella moellendorffii]|nr:E3 ubiquitin-protein ligase MARCH1 [Selaginella moellendorffii]|eukprot:XP_002984472.2 E3 ubiquitin-protein ligase MARCH1 [Selaginella moellendorffii]